jgi:hypothetical protein
MLPSRNLLQNGDFSRGLYQWTGDGTITRSLGYPRVNAAQLATGQALSQQIGISEENLYTLHYFYRVGTGATLTVAYGDVSQEHTGAPLDVWREGVLQFAVEAGDGNGAVQISAAGGTAYVDTITLMPGGLPASRAEMAADVAGSLGALATDAGVSTTASASGPEGDYSAAIDEALRAAGAMNRWGDEDVTLLDASRVNDAIEAARASMLQRVRATYALQTDVSLGPRSESRSQIASSIDEMLAGAGGSRRMSMGRLDHGDWRR